MLALFFNTLSVTAPVFSLLLLGWLLRRVAWIDDHFMAVASNLVFKAALPALLFAAIVQADFAYAWQPKLMGYFTLATLVTFALAWLMCLRYPRPLRGVLVQGAFRGNNGIVGLALAGSLYGDYGLSVGGVLAGLVILLYNVLAVIVLEVYSPHSQHSWRQVMLSIIKNPLIISVLLALPIAYWQLALPAWLLGSIKTFGSLSLPLALLCIGGTLALHSTTKPAAGALTASVLKVFSLPLLATLGAAGVGFSSQDLGILFLYFASPTAAASYVMAKAVGADEQLAARIIVLSTLLSIVTINLGLYLLHLVEG